MFFIVFRVSGLSNIGNLPAPENESDDVKLVAEGLKKNEEWILSVSPKYVSPTSFLGICSGTDMCALFETDIYEKTCLLSKEDTVVPTSAAMMRDFVNFFR